MINICRLCLCFGDNKTLKWREVSVIKLKLLACLHIDITNDELLPKQVCQNCIDKVDETFNFYNTVNKNQYLLNNLSKNGKEALENFYLHFITPKREEICTIKADEKKALQSKNIFADDIEIKSEKNDLEANITYSSDEDISLSSIKKVKYSKHKQITQEVPKKEQNEKDQELQNDSTIKDFNIKSENIDYDDNVNYSSDKELCLSSIKKANQRTKRKHRILKTVKHKKKISDAKENIQTAIGLDDGKLLNIEGSQYKCLTCFQLYHSRQTLLEHYKKEHYSENGKTDNIDNFISSDGVFKCTKCNKVFTTKKYVRAHLMSTHNDNRPFLCNLCGRTFKVVSEIINHARAHGGVKFCCSFKCGYSTSYIGGLRDHEKRHKQEYKYKCEKCGKGFQVKTWFEEHENIHTGARPFVCTLCGKGFHYNRHLTTHRTTVHPQSSALKRIICVHCSLPCDSKNALKEHLSHEHGIKSFFLCDFCGKTFASSAHLQSHKAIHSGLKRFSCSTCKKLFTRKSHLKRHELTHSDVKEHACGKCGKRFSRRSTLLRHSLRHGTPS